jgi:predicted transcriptional regulator YheO
MPASLRALEKRYAHVFVIAEAVAAWLHPHAEVVLHDLSSDRVVKLWNNVSRRKPGERSLIAQDVQVEDDRDVYGPYERSNWDGRRLKCVSAVVHDDRGERSGLICMNLDVSQFDALGAFVQAFAASTAATPTAFTERDWREQIHSALAAYLREINTALPALTRAQKIGAVRALDAQHLFATRNAAQHVGEILSVSRATVYNWLTEARRARR